MILASGSHPWHPLHTDHVSLSLIQSLPRVIQGLFGSYLREPVICVLIIQFQNCLMHSIALRITFPMVCLDTSL